MLLRTAFGGATLKTNGYRWGTDGKVLILRASK